MGKLKQPKEQLQEHNLVRLPFHRQGKKERIFGPVQILFLSQYVLELSRYWE